MTSSLDILRKEYGATFSIRAVPSLVLTQLGQGELGLVQGREEPLAASLLFPQGGEPITLLGQSIARKPTREAAVLSRRTPIRKQTGSAANTNRTGTTAITRQSVVIVILGSYLHEQTTDEI